MNIVEPIFTQAQNKPSELALSAPGGDFSLVSYARFARSVNSVCRRLIRRGIAPRSRFGVIIDDPIFHTIVVIALTRLGIATISGGQRDISWPVKLDGVIADKQYEFPGAQTILVDLAWTADNDEPIEDKHFYGAEPDDLCRLFVMSGRDRREKVIAMTNRMIAIRLDRQKLFFGPRAPFCDRTCLELPLETPLGFQVMLATLWRGGALVMARDLRKTVAALAVYNVQNVIASPQGLLKLGETTGKSPGSQNALTAIFSAGSIASQTESELVRARLCPNLTLGYVAADGTMVASMTANASSDTGAAGYVLPGVSVEIVDDEGRVLAPGREGDVRLKSDYGVSEYLEDPTATEHAFRRGWFHPGERGCFTKDYMLLLSGGSKVAAPIVGEKRREL